MINSISPRLLVRFLPDLVARVQTERNVLFLTFDDGPHSVHTAKILDLLSKYSAKATFFLCGKNLTDTGELLSEMVEEGHSIGNHSFLHRKWYFSASILRSELSETNRIIGEQVGVRPTLFRPPYGRLTPGMRKICNELHLKLVLWDVFCPDYRNGYPAFKIIKRIQRFSRPGSIVLLHDASSNVNQTMEALRFLIPYFQDKGYRFSALRLDERT